MITWQQYILRDNGNIEWALVRGYRAMLMQSSDIEVLRYGEIGVAVPAELLAYRQALRDITDTYSDPADVVFPDRPDIPFPGDAVSQGERLEAAELLLSLLLEDPLRGAI